MPALGEIAQLITALAACGALVVGWLNSRKIQAVHVDINSRMTELLQVTGNAARAEGIQQGRDQTNSGMGK